ncbi:endolytic transglycosylase MltG [Coxiella burnetii]|uniref:Endolytic murein transglycosylase n=1 Tax=Coxiella burnetii (strain RSA 493 / Nine Mile phase I) TaxID=227377 RepID=Q83E36_COXBU|nr:endolytic transglycosylase MltG [Coxiella burnetii]NP_819532.1 hypothetical protein CBU_0498 [Coxiella burnetii RSA 493]AAO90046.1 hypothetical exported protein [Coxiella burnetii RSA 493]ARI65375.1 hypothetical protein B7L74_02560 [Coxiella burnetii]ARK26854.1 hypothetical protein BMW92_02495 [Coxiella burnetii]MCF2093319.1 endolytic transglycosylase MltG [Coxiella burnetii]MCF2095787.1 endolytic transglycosylase MltG [Coxiella burnetii]
MSFFKKIILFIGAIVVMILGMWFAIVWHRFIHTPLQSDKAIQQVSTIKVPPGTGIHYLAKSLHEQGLLQNPQFFIWLARLKGDAPLLKAGEYEITPTMTPLELLRNVVAGKVKQRSITFIEGWTFREMKQTLEENPYIHHTIDRLSDQKILAKLGCTNLRPEGLFFPDTYSFTWGDNDIKILRQAYQRMQTILNEAWQQRADNLPYKNPYQALILASLVEKETALPKERPKIAGVILRRLKKGMPLQVDPTVLYGLGRPYGSPITKEDLVSNSPYNTYQHYGLPPTPIDMPSRASILAALKPESGDALYYVARGDGSHIFSATYKEHKEAIKKVFRRWRKTWELNAAVSFLLKELKEWGRQPHLIGCGSN